MIIHLGRGPCFMPLPVSGATVCTTAQYIAASPAALLPAKPSTGCTRSQLQIRLCGALREVVVGVAIASAVECACASPCALQAPPHAFSLPWLELSGARCPLLLFEPPGPVAAQEDERAASSRVRDAQHTRRNRRRDRKEHALRGQLEGAQQKPATPKDPTHTSFETMPDILESRSFTCSYRESWPNAGHHKNGKTGASAAR